MSVLTATKSYGIIRPGDMFEVVGRSAGCFQIKTAGDYRDWWVPMWVFQ